MRFTAAISCLCLAAASIALPSTQDRRQSFDRDPRWDGRNNRAATPAPRQITQDFAWSRTNHAGGAVGEIGGFITPDARPAYYARPIRRYTLQDPLSASGSVACTGRELNVLIGFFNSRTINEWRTPNTIALRLYGRGGVFYAYVEYMTAKWRAGAESPGGFATVRDAATGRERLRGFASGGAVHTWSLNYDPAGNRGWGTVTATLDGEKSVCNLAPGHKEDGATFDRFGLLNVVKHVDGGGEVWLDDVEVNGETERFTTDPGWDHRNNRARYLSANVRPRFHFGYSPTRFAGGRRRGELGGLVFRGDNRSPETMAYYGDRLRTLTLDRPLRAAGRVCLRRAVTDSTTLIGFFHSADSVARGDSQSRAVPNCFLGIAVEGPSRDGFLFYPSYCARGGRHSSAIPAGAPHIYPNGEAHDWTLEYSPDGEGRITVTLDGHPVVLTLSPGHKAQGARFDRFGIVTTWIDGNGQQIYFDDLTYTCGQP